MRGGKFEHTGQMPRALCAVLSFGLLILCNVVAAAAAEPGVSEWVAPKADGKLAYKTTESGDRIMDFSAAGYMGGGVALPQVPVKQTVSPSGEQDDTARIQAAIDEVAALPLTD